MQPRDDKQSNSAADQAARIVGQHGLRFEEFAEAMPLLVWTAKPDGTVDSFNSRAALYRASEMTADDDWIWQPIIHPDELEATLAAWQAAVRAGSSYQFEHRLQMADGSYRWHLSRAELFRSVDGTIRWYGTSTDIQDLRAAEIEASRANRTLDELVERAPFGMYIVDSEFRIAHMNIGSQNGAFRNVRPVIGRDFSDAMRILWPEEVAAEICASFRSTLDTGEPYHSSQFIRPRNDLQSVESYEWELHRMMLPDGQFGVICYYFDSTKLRQAEQALRESELRFRRLSEANIVGICEANPEGVLSGNDEFLRIIGITRTEFDKAGYDWQRMTPPEFVSRDEDAFRQLKERGWCDAFEKQLIDQSGRRVPILLGAAVFRQDPLTWVSFVLDLTTQKQTEAALIQTEKLASVGRMAATIAHEINNPLAAVTNSVFLARTFAESPEKVREMLDGADHELRRIAHLTRQALGFYRDPNEPVPFSLTSVLDSAIDLLKSKVDAKHAQVRKHYQTDPTLVGMPGELRQIFSNLLGNALDAIDNSGIIDVSLGGSEDQQSILIKITDDGTGIKPEILPHVFEPFFTTKTEVGTGLGLWISRQLVERQGGSIYAESASGEHRGTTISMVLPKNRPVR